MDWNAVARFFKTSNRLIKRRVLIGLAVILMCLPTLLTHLFFWRIERRLHLKINEKPLFTLVPGFIQVKNVSLEWKDRLRVRSGSLTIHYNPFAAIFQKEFPLSLQGQNLAIEPGPDLREALGSSQVVFDRLSTKLLIRTEHGVDFEFLDAESKTIQFHLGRSPQTS